MEPFAILVLAVLLGLIPAKIASNKGREFIVWWIYGALIFIVALPHAMLTGPDEEGLELRRRNAGSRKCPFCAEWIKKEARVCRYCGRESGLTQPARFCTECGTKQAAANAFCTECGKPVSVGSAPR